MRECQNTIRNGEIMGRLLISVRGPNEALEAAKGGAHIADVEFPGSAQAKEACIAGRGANGNKLDG